uniref:hypothetical protein n=1 Tax=Pseudomonas sp. JAI120 TaxID=2723063 RepID=UPI0030D6F33A
MACTLFTAQTSFALIASVLFVGGLSRSMQFTCYNSIGFADVPEARMSEASALFSLSFPTGDGAGSDGGDAATTGLHDRARA